MRFGNQMHLAIRGDFKTVAGDRLLHTVCS